MIRICTFICFFLLLSHLSAQSLERDVISPWGHFDQAGNYQISATVGEVATTTEISGSIILTQGFQQGDADTQTGINRSLEVVVDYRLFPNPTAGIVHLHLSSKTPIEVMVNVWDVRGRKTLIPDQTINITQPVETTVDLSPLAEGNYLLVVKTLTGETGHTFRVQKLN